ncbi:S-layer homology domain-containing protein, partial [Bacillus thuringiensis]
FAKLISNSLQLPSGNANFKDLDHAHPTLQDGIKRTASAGIIQGRGDGIFDPNSPITREESAIMVDKALQYKGIVGDLNGMPFRDKHLINYKDAVSRLFSLGVVNGVGNNEFNPHGTTTRGESAAYLMKMLNVMENNKVIGELTINDFGLEIHKEATNDSGLVRKAFKGEVINVLAEKDGWYKVGANEWIQNSPSKMSYQAK